MRSKPMLAIFVTIFIDLLGFGVVIPILPNFASGLGASPVQVGMVAGIYSLMNFIFANFWGTLSDRIGRRPVILISALITAASYFLFGFATNLIILFISRLLAGIGSANFGAAQAYMSDITTPEERPKAMGLLGAAFGLGFIFGPLIGGILKTNFGVEGLGIGAAMLSLINFVMAWFMLPESIKEKNTHRAFRFAPVSDLLKAMKNELYRDIFLANFIFITAFSIMQITAPLLWNQEYGLDDKHIAYLFVFIGVCSAIVQGGLVGKLSRRFSPRQMVYIGIACMTVGLASLPFATKSYFILMECAGLLIICIANGFLTPALTSLVSLLAPPMEAGKILGLNQSMASLARVAGPLIGGFVYGFHFTLPYLTGAGLMIVCFIVMKSFFTSYKVPE
jgi:DHA1 family tetracycline resistance protein-like MFS transporter